MNDVAFAIAVQALESRCLESRMSAARCPQAPAVADNAAGCRRAVLICIRASVALLGSSK